MRRLMPLTSLRAFEVAARHQNFSRAAEELGVTQGAISRQIARLETELGVRLFARRGRFLELTPDGRRLHFHVAAGFGKLSEGLELFVSAERENTLKVKVPPTLGVRWFVPRLVHFHGRYPEIDVQITTSHQAVNFETEDVDVAICWGTGDWPGLSVDLLLLEDLTPMLSPTLLATRPLRHPRDLAGLVLLHSMNRTNDWRVWFRAAGVDDVDLSRTVRFENSALTYQAAIEGMGAVVAQRAFVADDVATGRLVAPFPLTVRGEQAYYLIVPPRRKKRPDVAAFRKWLLATAAAERAAAPAHGIAPAAGGLRAGG